MKHSNFARSCLTNLLGLLGLLAPTARITIRHPGFRAGILMALSAFSLLYEITLALTTLTNEKLDKKIAYTVNISQYSIKALVTLIILGAFWWKSYVISNFLIISKTALDQAKILQRRKCGKNVSGRVMVAFLLYLVMIVTFRVLRVVLFHGNPDEKPYPTVLWPTITTVQEQAVILLVRNATESVRLLCSGYVAGLLYDLADGLCSQCRVFLEQATQDPQRVMYVDLQRAWDARELSISMAGKVQRQLSGLLAFILLSDMVSLFSTIGDFLFFTNYIVYIHNCASIVLYIASLMAVSGGLIALHNEVSTSADCVLRGGGVNFCDNFQHSLIDSSSVEHVLNMSNCKDLNLLTSTYVYNI